jgi:hypothetical protein
MQNTSAQRQTAALMPSPVQASGPQNEAEAKLAQLILQGLQSGAPTEYANAGDFTRSLRAQAGSRASTAGMQKS